MTFYRKIRFLPKNLVRTFNSTVRVFQDRRFAGNPFSRILRRVAENKNIRNFFGFNLTAVALFTGILIQPFSVFSPDAQAEVTAINPGATKLVTENALCLPVKPFRLNQGYSFLHRGIDIGAKIDDPVYSVADGTIEKVEYSFLSYGHHLVINHGSGFRSLYAHLGKIFVKTGEKVKKNTIIGLVGTTGLTTGPHLHFEFSDHGQSINPLAVLSAETE